MKRHVLQKNRLFEHSKREKKVERPMTSAESLRLANPSYYNWKNRYRGMNHRMSSAYSTTGLWEDDRVNYSWTISMNSVDSHINIKIDQLSSPNLGYKEMLIHEDIETRKLFDAIYKSLEEMLADFGFFGYKKKWEVGNLPIAEYITLKAARERIDLRNISVYLHPNTQIR